MVKHFAFLKNICYQYLNFVLAVTDCFFSLRTADWPTANFLGMYCCYLVIRMFNLVKMAPLLTVVHCNWTNQSSHDNNMATWWVCRGQKLSGVGGGLMVPLKFTKWSLDIVSPFLPATTTCDPSLEVLKEVKPPST